MIAANNVTLRVGKKALFEDVNIKFTEGNCYGMIGANGAGKSTFLKILSGQLEPTNGDVTITPGQRLSFLEQDHFKYDQYPVLDTVIMGNARLYEIMKEKEVINVCSGRRLGCIADVEINICTGEIEAIVIPGPGKICGFFGTDCEYVIPFSCIKKIGPDIVLVEIKEEKFLQKF